MANLKEIKDAIDILRTEGTQKDNITVLHANTMYPTPMRDVNLKAMLTIGETFDISYGYSDHTLGIEVDIAAVAMGAKCIEKHFTLDKTKIGMDNQMATEPNQMKQLVENCDEVQKALGDTKRVVLSAELDQRKQMRRSIVVTKDLQAGSKLTYDDLDVKRPGTGFPPEHIDNLIGKNLCRDIVKDTMITKEDIN